MLFIIEIYFIILGNTDAGRCRDGRIKFKDGLLHMKNVIEEGQICWFDTNIPKITDEDIKRVLMFKHGLGYIEARIKVYKYFKSNGNSGTEEFLKEIFGTGGIINGKDSKGNMYSDRYGEYGISIYKGERKLFMPWAYVNTEISLLIRDNIYFSDEEKIKYGLI